MTLEVFIIEKHMTSLFTMWVMRYVLDVVGSGSWLVLVGAAPPLVGRLLPPRLPRRWFPPLLLWTEGRSPWPRRDPLGPTSFA